MFCYYAGHLGFTSGRNFETSTNWGLSIVSGTHLVYKVELRKERDIDWKLRSTTGEYKYAYI